MFFSRKERRVRKGNLHTQNDMKQIHLNIPDGLKETVRKTAKEYGWTVNKCFIHAMEYWLDRQNLDFSLEDTISRFAGKNGIAKEELDAWREFLDKNDWRYFSNGEKITVKNFRNSLLAFVKRRREEAQLATPGPANAKDKYGFTEADYEDWALYHQISIEQAKQDLQSKGD